MNNYGKGEVCSRTGQTEIRLLNRPSIHVVEGGVAGKPSGLKSNLFRLDRLDKSCMEWRVISVASPNS